MTHQTFNISNKPIYLIDNQVEDEDIISFNNIVQELSFVKSERDFEEDKFPIFSVDFDIEKFEQKMAIGKKSRELLERFYPDDDYRLFRAYINMSHYGDVEFPHRDCDVVERNITVLYYVNKIWNYTWGGETVFYENDESTRCVLPKPGRFLIFPGSVQHMGSIPTRICSQSRLTLAMKYKISN